MQSRYCSTKSELALRLGVKYGTLLSYFRQAGRPANHGQGHQRYEVEAWQQWIQDRRFKQAGVVTYDPSAKEKSIIEKNKIAAAQAQFDLDVKMGRYVSRLQANRDIDTGNAIVRRELEKLVKHTLPPKLEGLSASQIAQVAMVELNKVLKFLPGHFQAAANANGNGS